MSQTTRSRSSRRIFLADREVDLDAGVVRLDSARVHSLTPLELALLRHLVHSGCTVSSKDLLREVWGYHPSVRSRAVSLTISRLRRKVEPIPGRPRHLVTRFGRGYALVDVKAA